MFYFYGITVNNTEPGEILIDYGDNFRKFQHTFEPVETIHISQQNFNFKSRMETKCLTFFSHVQQVWRKFQAQIDSITIKMQIYSK